MNKILWKLLTLTYPTYFVLTVVFVVPISIIIDAFQTLKLAYFDDKLYSRAEYKRTKQFAWKK